MEHPKWWVFNKGSENEPVQEVRIERAKVLDVLDKSLRSSGVPEETSVHVHEAVASSESVDFATFKCVGGCGCPMTQAGYVLFKAAEEHAVHGERPQWAVSFTGRFDGGMRALVNWEVGKRFLDGIGGPTLVHMI